MKRVIFSLLLLSLSLAFSSPLFPWHTQSDRSRLHPGSNRIRAGPRWPRPLQRPGTGDLRPSQAQVQRRGAEATAHDQEGTQGLHSWWYEGKNTNIKPQIRIITITMSFSSNSRGTKYNIKYNNNYYYCYCCLLYKY